MGRINYWSSSVISQWLRSKFGLRNPSCLSSEGWSEWQKECKIKSPFIHWLTDTFFDRIQDFFCWPKDKLWDIRCALNSRFFDKCHYLPTKLNPWQYHEVDTRILHGLFETLVDFIEIEKAWMHVICGQEENQKKYGYKWYELNGWTSWFASEKRHPLAGIEYLEWEMSLVKDDSWYGDDIESIELAKQTGEYGQLTSQAEMAKEQFELYHWWKNIRPLRQHPHDKSGYSAYFEKLRSRHNGDFFAALNDRSSDLEEEGRKCSIICNEIEVAYDNEDTQMLIRLIKIRNSLWT